MLIKKAVRNVLFCFLLFLIGNGLVGCLSISTIASEKHHHHPVNPTVDGNPVGKTDVWPTKKVIIPLNEPLKVTVNEAILLGLDNNSALMVERLNPEIRQTFEDQESAVFDPVLKADVSVSDKNVEITDDKDQKAGSSAANIGVSKLFPTGTDPKIGIEKGGKRKPPVV